ncbi:MAG: hypothetical protein ACJ72X_07440 [Nitrososphaeraceae archaeon]
MTNKSTYIVHPLHTTITTTTTTTEIDNSSMMINTKERIRKKFIFNGNSKGHFHKESQ